MYRRDQEKHKVLTTYLGRPHVCPLHACLAAAAAAAAAVTGPARLPALYCHFAAPSSTRPLTPTQPQEFSDIGKAFVTSEKRTRAHPGGGQDGGMHTPSPRAAAAGPAAQLAPLASAGCSAHAASSSRLPLPGLPPLPSPPCPALPAHHAVVTWAAGNADLNPLYEDAHNPGAGGRSVRRSALLLSACVVVCWGAGAAGAWRAWNPPHPHLRPRPRTPCPALEQWRPRCLASCLCLCWPLC